jgi:Flp pilus assembly protein TadG
VKRTLRTVVEQVRDQSGAVYVEFLIAFLPLFLFFSALVQLGMVQIADLVTKHAAVTAARAAIVVLTDDPKYYGGAPVNQAAGARMDHIRRAAEIPLTAVDPQPGNSVGVRFPSTAGGTDDKSTFGEEDVVRVRVEYSYPCGVPVGSRLICGLAGRKMLYAEAAMPNQGPNYDYQD